MNTVAFPILNLTVSIHKIAFTVFGIPIYWYAILIVLAIGIAFFRLQKKNGLFGISYSQILDLSLWVLPIAFLGARAYYILFYPETSWTQFFDFRTGGLAIYRRYFEWNYRLLLV